MYKIRQLVSRSRKRFVENGYNLDLTYITSQIIATSYPSSGVEKAYRNPIEQVSTLTRLLNILFFIGITIPK